MRRSEWAELGKDTIRYGVQSLTASGEYARLDNCVAVDVVLRDANGALVALRFADAAMYLRLNRREMRQLRAALKGGG